MPIDGKFFDQLDPNEGFDQPDDTISAIEGHFWSFIELNVTLLSPFRVVYATPLNSNTIRVFLSKEPKRISPLATDDVFLRTNWVISVISGPGTAPVVERVENPLPQPDLEGQIAIDGSGNPIDGPIPDGWSVDVRTDRRILASVVYLIVASASIASADGLDTMAGSPFDRDDHPGIHVPRPRPAFSPPGIRPGLDIRYDTFRGVFILDSKTDLDLHGGDEALKKRIIRRLLSRPGGFFHLPNYGVGLRSKEPFNSTRLSQLQAEILRQVRQEEEIERLSVDVSFDAGILFISITVQTRTQRSFVLDLTVPEDGQIFVG